MGYLQVFSFGIHLLIANVCNEKMKCEKMWRVAGMLWRAVKILWRKVFCLPFSSHP
jgi:hypothetical protein